MKCPYCGTNNPPGDDFCANCGGYLLAAPTDATVHVSTAVNTPPTPIIPPQTIVTGGGLANGGTLAQNARLQNGRYVVERILGQGGMGAAVLARDTRVSNKLVVIKELVPENSDPTKLQDEVRNFELEVETLASLDHPLIPSVTDSFQEFSRYFMVQEYAAGENLEALLLQQNQALPEKEVLEYTVQVLDILQYLAQQQPPIVHRDIKPANIIIGAKDKRARLVDFGIARAEANRNLQKKQTSALGTPGYAPPEQYQGNADARSDLYALAATLHHILSNRDPRDFPPFVYPAIRTLNSKLSPDIERVLDRALRVNITERYQSPIEMRRDVESILVARFRSSGDMSSYTLHTSGPMPAMPPLPNQQGGYATSHATTNPITPPPPPGGYLNQQQHQVQVPAQNNTGWSPPPMSPTKTKARKTNPALALFIVLILLGLIGGGLFIFLPKGQPTTTGTTANSLGFNNNPISTVTLNNELIGISDGSFAFDTNRPDGDLKKRASASYSKGDFSNALALWREAVDQETNDAEALIYLENEQIKNKDHITIVVGSAPSGKDTLLALGQDNLQGVYVAQKQWNTNNTLNGLKVKVLIASSGSSTESVTAVAEQIVKLASSDKTFVGVVGWPHSDQTYKAVEVFNKAGIPMVSQTASDDGLTGYSNNFFRVAPANAAQGTAGARYAIAHGAKNIALFRDPQDPYSQSLASKFKNEFEKAGGTVTALNYTRGQAGSITKSVADMLSKNPDMIYFSGYSSDVVALLKELDSMQAPANLNVLGGDALYELGAYQDVPGFDRLRFTAFAYPDEWGIAGLTGQMPAFFTDYKAYFNPRNEPKSYGFSRADSDVILTYDAAQALLLGAGRASPSSGTLSYKDIAGGLNGLGFQGVSGWVSLGNDGDPVNKAIVILWVKGDRTIHLEKEDIIGQFLKP